MKEWPHKVSVTPIRDVLQAVKDDRWQSFRLSLKGVSTETKLQRLHEYRTSSMKKGNLPEVERLRIDNYINALLRGGQLVRSGQQIMMQR